MIIAAGPSLTLGSQSSVFCGIAASNYDNNSQLLKGKMEPQTVFYNLSLTSGEQVTADGRNWYTLMMAIAVSPGQQIPSCGSLIRDGVLPETPTDNVEIIQVHLVDNGKTFCKDEYKVSNQQVGVHSDVLAYVCGTSSIAVLRSHPLLAASAFMLLGASTDRNATVQTIQNVLRE